MFQVLYKQVLIHFLLSVMQHDQLLLCNLHRGVQVHQQLHQQPSCWHLATSLTYTNPARQVVTHCTHECSLALKTSSFEWLPGLLSCSSNCLIPVCMFFLPLHHDGVYAVLLLPPHSLSSRSSSPDSQESACFENMLDLFPLLLTTGMTPASTVTTQQ